MFSEELVRSNHLEDANKVFLKGAKGGLRATDEIYDLMIEEDCKSGDHSNALTIAYEMEAAGRMATTFHFNCLLSVQVENLNITMLLLFYNLILSRVEDVSDYVFLMSIACLTVFIHVVPL